ncbi:hypothetical protein B0A48_02376 [Cryoendolithus antarcticus]|uniref:Mannose-P-dolichol utilization defect 1 protein homolog n=1 Tax=Cryoendolithus antarcticus TaxID=1507870 RepID=A0A1V8TNY2_9PEZI|nr:hypothetical protein B0A48_02376 [Cryoendolithus antarcticus]
MEALESTLRSVLGPITQHLPAPLQSAGTQLIGESCYRSLVHDLTITDTVCLKLGISKALGVGIIAASSIVKIPQLLKLLNSQSAEGISFLSYFLETVSYLISLLYNVRNRFPFSTYGETALIGIQNVAISVLVLNYTGRGALAAAFVAGLAAVGYALYSETITSMATFQYLSTGAAIMGVASKLPQIYSCYKEQGTGQLSAFAVFNYLAGSLTRIFTTLQEVDDKIILYNFIAGFALNAILAAQMIYYWNSPTTGKTPEHKLTSAGKAALKEPIQQAAEQIQAQTSGTEKRSSPTTRRRG